MDLTGAHMISAELVGSAETLIGGRSDLFWPQKLWELQQQAAQEEAHISPLIDKIMELHALKRHMNVPGFVFIGAKPDEHQPDYQTIVQLDGVVRLYWHARDGQWECTDYSLNPRDHSADLRYIDGYTLSRCFPENVTPEMIQQAFLQNVHMSKQQPKVEDPKVDCAQELAAWPIKPGIGENFG